MALSICVAASANWPEYGMISPILTGCCACAGNAAKTASAAKTAAKCRFMVCPPPCLPQSLFPPELPGELRLRYCIGVDHVAGERGARAFPVETVHLERIQREVVAVRLVARGRAGAAPARATEIGFDLRAAERQVGAIGLTRVLPQLDRVRRNVEDDPVPPARAAGRGVRIVHQQSEALRVLRRARPPEGGRDVLARTAEAVEHLLHGDSAVRPDVGAHELELGARRALLAGFGCHDSPPCRYDSL